MSARTEVVEFLTQELGDQYSVLPHARTPDGINKTTLMVEIQKIAQGPAGGVWECDMTISVMTGLEDFAKAEDELDVAIEKVMNVLDGLSHVGLGADRSVFAEKYHGYLISIKFPLAKSDPESE